MRDLLAEYRKKRDFGNTPEPDPKAPVTRSDDVFVIHRHEARQLHYDLRLEHEGVLKSWAVPRGSIASDGWCSRAPLATGSSTQSAPVQRA